MKKQISIDEATGEVTKVTDLADALGADMQNAMLNELQRAADRFWRYNHSTHESYSLIREELEEAQEALKVIPDGLKEAWKQVRTNDDIVFATMCDQIQRDALRAAGECIQLAAMAMKASDSVYHNA